MHISFFHYISYYSFNTVFLSLKCPFLSFFLSFFQLLIRTQHQARRHIFKSGQAEVKAIRNKWEGVSTKYDEGVSAPSPSYKGGSGISPEKILIYNCLYVRF